MTDTERDSLRALQDRWLHLPAVRYQVGTFGEGGRIAGTPDAPTFRDVRTLLLPLWRGWFEEFVWEEEAGPS